MNTPTSRFFVAVDCPLCGSPDYIVLVPSKYHDDMVDAELRGLYSASSDHVLLDQIVRCRSCDLIYVNPRIDSKLIIEGYSGAADPGFVANNLERISTFRRVLIRICRRLGLTPSPHHRILDVGCAGGAFPKAAADLGFQVTGVEPSAWLAEFGRQKYNIDVRQGVLQADMFPPASFDIVTMWDVVEHLTNPHEVLTIISALLREDGWLIVNYPDVGSLAARCLRSYWPFWLSVHLIYYTRTTIARQLERAGFDIVHAQPHWQRLKLSYVLFRASQYFSVFSSLKRVADRIGIGEVPVTYNMGQTLIVARKRR
jgi:2-polyprenyl-3-methyl-5-hydroxy-6-metoxy-1,4-benzoquinol methylase